MLGLPLLGKVHEMIWNGSLLERLRLIRVADYIPALASIDSAPFGLAMVLPRRPCSSVDQFPWPGDYSNSSANRIEGGFRVFRG